MILQVALLKAIETIMIQIDFLFVSRVQVEKIPDDTI